MHVRDLVAEKFFTVKPEPDQALSVAPQGDAPQGRRVASKVLHRVSSSYRRPEDTEGRVAVAAPLHVLKAGRSLGGPFDPPNTSIV